MNRLKSLKIQSMYKLAFMSQRKKKMIGIVSVMTLVMLLNIDVSYAKPTFDEAWEAFMSEYRIILAGIAGLGALTSVLVFIVHFVKLGTMPSHPIQRREALTNMVISGVCTALLGGITLVLTLFYHIIFQGGADVTPTTTVPASEADFSEYAPDDTSSVTGSIA